MKYILITLIFVFAMFVQAEQRKIVKKPRTQNYNKNKILVETKSPNFPTEKLDPKIYTVKTSSESEILPPEQRDKIFEKARVTEYVEKMDHLDKDLLLLRSKNLELKDFQSKYPHIPAKLLNNLSQIAKQTN